MSLYQIIVGVSLAWMLVSSISFGYALIWTLRHPRRKFTPPPPKPPRQPFTVRSLPSVEPTRVIRSQALRRPDFDNWLRRQDMLANPHIIEMSEWRNSRADAK